MRRHSLHDECRILLVHGLLHTLGHDHEEDEEALKAMTKHEQALLTALDWQVSESQLFKASSLLQEGLAAQ